MATKKILSTSDKNKMDKILSPLNLQTKSAKIRILHSKGYSRSDIALYLDIRYQHVRNVLISPLKGS